MPGVSTSANPYAPPRARVQDVAAPRAALVLAERSSRLGAAIVDSLIFSVMVYVPMGIGAAIGRAGADGDDAAGPVLLMVGLTLGFHRLGVAHGETDESDRPVARQEALQHQGRHFPTGRPYRWVF